MRKQEEIRFNVRTIVWLTKRLPREKQAEFANRLLEWLEASGISECRLSKIKQRVQEGLGLDLEAIGADRSIGAG